MSCTQRVVRLDKANWVHLATQSYWQVATQRPLLSFGNCHKGMGLLCWVSAPNDSCLAVPLRQGPYVFQTQERFIINLGALVGKERECNEIFQYKSAIILKAQRGRKTTLRKL